MKPMLTSKYYLVRIGKSKSFTDLADALKAYYQFKESRSRFAVQQYITSIKKLDVVSATEALIIPLV